MVVYYIGVLVLIVGNGKWKLQVVNMTIVTFSGNINALVILHWETGASKESMWTRQQKRYQPCVVLW